MNDGSLLFNSFINHFEQLTDESHNVVRSGNDVVIINSLSQQLLVEYYGVNGYLGTPVSLNNCIGTFIRRGKLKGSLGSVSFETEGMGLLIALPNTIMTFEKASDDFEGRVMILSEAFLIGLNLNQSLMAHISVRHQVFYPFNDAMMAGVDIYFDQMTSILLTPNNPFRIEAASSLTAAMFYTSGYYMHLRQPTRERSTPEFVADQFLRLLEKHCKEHHELPFYADMMCMSPKYLSRCVKLATGSSALEWIQRQTVKQAQALLLHSNLSVLEISNKLQFPNQSLFSKYFKRVTGISPTEYQRKHMITSHPKQ